VPAGWRYALTSGTWSLGVASIELACAFLALAALALAAGAAATGAAAGGRALISNRGSERATAGIDNKIVTLDGKTHVTWQDVDEKEYFASVRTLDRATGVWSEPVRIGPGVDNHARPCMTVDSRGHLHVVIGGHNTDMHHYVSVRPNDSSQWRHAGKAGVGTYPALICGADDTLYLVARPETHAGVELRVRPRDGEWTSMGLVLQREPQYAGYAGYNTTLAWGPGQRRLHLACDVYEGYGTYKGRGANQLIVYMASDDFGKTWKKADGSAIEPPFYPGNLDVIAVNCRKREQDMPTPVLRLGGMVVDSKGTPFVFYVQHEPEPGGGFLAAPDGKDGWKRIPLSGALAGHWPGCGVLEPRGALSITAGDVIQMCLPIAPGADFGVPGGSANIKPGSVRWVWVETPDGGETFRMKELIAPDGKTERHCPTLEKPTGFNVVEAGRAAGLLYFEGLHRYRQPGELIQTTVFYTETGAAQKDASAPAQFRLWAMGCAHVGTDLRHGRESLADAIRQSEEGAGAFDWDIAVNLGDFSGTQTPPDDAEGREVVRQYSAARKHRREDFYDLAGNHDASGPAEPCQWWFRKWIDPTGESTEFSGVDSRRRPYPVEGTWERYSFRAGNLLFLMMSDRNDGGPPVGRGAKGGYPAGAVSGETFEWWKRMVEANQDSIIISCHHHMLKETTVASGPWEGFTKDEQGKWRGQYHGYFPDGGPEGASYLYFVDGKPDAQAFERYLAAHPGAIDLWLGAHTHTNPDDTCGGRSHIERKWAVTFINVAALTKHHMGRVKGAPMSRLLVFQEGSAEARVRCYLHTSDHAPQGWYAPAERVVPLRMPFRFRK
jgi:hypothetical protein